MATDKQQVIPPDVQPTPESTVLKRVVKWALAVSVGFSLIGFFANALLTAYWIGRGERTLRFSILDLQSNAPVANATITVFPGPPEINIGMSHPEPNDSDARTPHLSSAENGMAETRYDFVSSGNKNWFSDSGRVHFGGYYIRVGAAEDEPTQFRLGERLGEDRDYHDKSPIELVVKLKPAIATGEPEVD